MLCRALGQKWNMPLELAFDLCTLALYDIAIYADDSTSMKYAEGMLMWSVILFSVQRDVHKSQASQ